MDLYVFVNPVRLAGLSDALMDEAREKASELAETWSARERARRLVGRRVQLE